MFEDRLDEPRHLDHRLAVLVVGLGVEPRVARDLALCLRVIVDAPQVIAVRHRREGAVERQDLEAVARQIEIADDLRPQQRHDVRADREAGSPGKTSSVTAAPPTTWRRSSTSTFRPARARYAAAVRPLWPPPMTIASYFIAEFGLRIVGCGCVD